MTAFRPDLKEKLLTRISEEPAAPTRVQVKRRSWISLSTCGLLAIAVFIFAGGFRKLGAPRPFTLTAGTFGFTAILAAFAYSRIVSRRHMMFERPTQQHLLLLIGIPAAFYVWKLSYSWLFAGGLADWPTRFGNKCLMLTLTMGASLMCAYVGSWSNTVTRHPALVGGSLGIAAGVSASVLVELWCPVGHPFHVAYGHLLPMLLLGALGAIFAGRRIRLRP